MFEGFACEGVDVHVRLHVIRSTPGSAMFRHVSASSRLKQGSRTHQRENNHEVEQILGPDNDR